MSARYLATQASASELARANTILDQNLTELMRRTAQPYPYRFELRRIGGK